MGGTCDGVVDENLKRPGESLGAEEYEEGLRAMQELLCTRDVVDVVAYERQDIPPYVAHVYMLDDNGVVWAGTVWRPERLPTVDEIADALTRWRGPAGPRWRVSWFEEEKK